MATQLVEASQQGDVARVKTLMGAVAPIEIAHALQAARDQPEIIALLAPELSTGALDSMLRKWGAGVPEQSVRAILSAGAGVNGDKEDGETPLGCFAELGDTTIVRVLIEAGADVDSIRRMPMSHPLWKSSEAADGYGPLVNAIRGGHAEVVRILLDAGADPNRLTQAYRTPLEMAEVLDETEVAEIIRARGGGPVDPSILSLFQAASRGFEQRVETLLPQSTLGQRSSALAAASQSGHAALIHRLAKELPAQRLGECLCLSAGRNLLGTCKALISAGAKVDSHDSLGWTPMIWAAYRGCLQVIRVLSQAGADINKHSLGDLFTPLHKAAENGHLEVVEALLGLGANPNAIANDGSTPLSRAEHGDHQDVTATLKNAGASHQDIKERRKAVKTKLKKLSIPAIRPVLTPGEGEPKASRFGGRPFVPEGSQWPGSTAGPLSFFVQIDLGEAPKKLSTLFGPGLLQVFHARSSHESLVRILPLDAPGFVADPPAETLSFAPKQVTGWSRAKADFPVGASDVEQWKALDASERTLSVDLNQGGDKLGGWPTWIQGPQYPKCRSCGAAMKQMVLQLDSHCTLPFAWGDGGVAYVFQCAEHSKEVTLSYQSV